MTGVVVTYNTQALFQRAYESVRKFLPHMDIVIVDGSEEKDPCFHYVASLRKEARIFQLKKNIGHGPGMDFGIRSSHDSEVMVFDSDIVMLRNPLSEMVSLIDRDTYGVGWVTEVGHDGFDFGTPDRGHTERIPYLHPYFMILNVRQYYRFSPFVHHGAPCYKAMLDIYRKGLSERILKPFLTGHTSGHGINWKGRPSPWIRHDFGGTRKTNKMNGLKEIPGRWER